MPSPNISLFHRAFDKLYPAIRFAYERIRGDEWFSRITPADGITASFWLGGAPTYRRDYDFLLAHGINAVVNIRSERADDTAFYDQHGITHTRYFVSDIVVPDSQIITEAVAWIRRQVEEGRSVLVHCAKGRGRSAVLLAAYLMWHEGMTFDQAAHFLRSRRPLTKLQGRHRRQLENWLAMMRSQNQGRAG